MRALRAADYRRMPWRNGGGTTTEIFVVPEAANTGSERFLYRLSIADVAVDGPFSKFDGYDRHILLLEGAGMTLECGEHGALDLTPYVPRSFSGDWTVHGKLANGPVRDFNLIVDRARATATLATRLIQTAETIEVGAGAVALVYVISGELAGIPAGDTVVADATVRLDPRGPTRIAVAQVVPKAP